MDRQEETPQPEGLLHGMKYGHVFGLARRGGDNDVLARSPTDCGTRKEEEVATGGIAHGRTASSVAVAVVVEAESGGALVEETEMRSGRQVAKDLFHGGPVSGRRRLLKLRPPPHRKRQLRAAPRHKKDKGPNGLAVGDGGEGVGR